MLHRILTASRMIVLIAVLGSFVASLAALVIGGVQTVQVIAHAFATGLPEKATKEVAVSLIAVIDLFLIGVVFYIIALGLYELFIDDRLELPSWLVIDTLDDLKSKLINSMVVIMSVFFLGLLVDWNGKDNLLPLSGSVALVIAALTFFQYVNRKDGH
jgi:uncharacterized membrane protein YqhA